MSTNGILCLALYGAALFLPLVTYFVVPRRNRAVCRLSQCGFGVSGVILLVFLLSLRWEFGYTGATGRIWAWDGMFAIDVVHKSASGSRLKELGYAPNGWSWRKNTVVRVFIWWFLPVRVSPTRRLLPSRIGSIVAVRRLGDNARREAPIDSSPPFAILW